MLAVELPGNTAFQMERRVVSAADVPSEGKPRIDNVVSQREESDGRRLVAALFGNVVNSGTVGPGNSDRGNDQRAHPE